MYSNQTSSVPASTNKHFQELKQLRETKDFIISESLKKQKKNQSILNQIDSVSQDFQDLENLLKNLDGSSAEFQQIEPDLKDLQEDLEKLEVKKKEILESSENNRLNDLCGQIESLFESLQSFSSASIVSQPREEPSKKDEENFLELKKKIDQNKSKTLQNEEEFIKETKKLENIQKDLTSLMKMKLDKELEISILLKREEMEQKMHDEQLEKLATLKTVQNCGMNPEFRSKIQKKIELFPENPSESLKNKEENQSKGLILAALCLLALVYLVYN